MFAIGVLHPPAHPSCRCAVAYEETDDGARNATMHEKLSALDEQQRIAVLGQTKAALFDAGLLDEADYFKPLKDIDLSGIIIPDKTAVKHSMIGDYVKPSPGRPGGRLDGGGHTDAAMHEMDKRGIAYNVSRTDANGVRFGYVPDHVEKFKRTGEKQTWFPVTWTEHDIRTAGILAANNGNPVSGYSKEASYKGINVRVNFTKGRLSSIFPSYD